MTRDYTAKLTLVRVVLVACAVYVIVLVVLWVVSWQSVRHFGVNSGADSGVPFSAKPYLGGWLRFDSYWYVRIAADGYSHPPTGQSTVAFFPAYPLAVRAIGRATNDYAIAGIAVTVAAGLGAASLYLLWLRDKVMAAAVPAAFLTLLLYPYGWFMYGAVYSEALFLVAVLAAFVLVESDRPVLAGLAGFVATATRPIGIALVVGLAVRTLERRGALVVPADAEGATAPRRVRRLLLWARVPTRVDLRKLERRDAGVLLSMGGMVAYCAYLWHRFGDPLLFSSVQEYWGQPNRPYTWSKREFVEFFLHGDDPIYAWGNLAQGLLALAALAAVPLVARRFGWGYGSYVFLAVGIAFLGSKDFHALGRYLIPAFPLFALCGEALASRPLSRRVVLPCSAVLLAVMTAGFARGVFLS